MTEKIDQKLLDILQSRFGFPEFRPSQLEVVRHISQGNDALVVMPTGAGKSLCYQLPALAIGGLTVVVSPLLALMKDQVDALVAKNIRATFINSTLRTSERRQRMQEVMAGYWELLYVAPERFSPEFIEKLKNIDIRLLAIDEAHCLSQWGHDFRPDYLRLGKVRKALGMVPTVALTATATPEVRADISKTLGIGDAQVFVTGFDRENLLLEVRHTPKNTDKINGLIETLQSISGPALIYCATRKNVEQVTVALRDRGVAAAMYHAGMDIEERVEVQEGFMADRFPVVVATNAFGMGVDKKDVRCIIHWEFPGTVEAYYQEIGRAGRDGKDSKVVLLYRDSDRFIQDFFIRSSYPPLAYVYNVWQWLNQQDQNPLFFRLEELAQALPNDANERTASSCVYVLQRAGYVRRIPPSEREGRVSFRGNPPPLQIRGIRKLVYHALLQQRKNQDSFALRLDWFSQFLHISREQLVAALRALEERGFIVWNPPDRVGGVELLRKGQPLELDEDELQVRREQELAKVTQMQAYARSSCRRRYLVEYFGQQAAWERCGSCDECTKYEQQYRALQANEQEIVSKLLACVARMGQSRQGKSFSPTLIAKVARGSNDARVRTFGFESLSTHGILAGFSEGSLITLIKELQHAGALAENFVTRTISGREYTYPEYKLTDLGWQVMNGRAHGFRMHFPHTEVKKSRKSKSRNAKRTTKVVTSHPNDELLQILRRLRQQLAKLHDVPAYVVAPNKTLEDMAVQQPISRDAMQAVHGMGPGRMHKYGRPFLEKIRMWKKM